jgi:CxxC motif-containing protein
MIKKELTCVLCPNGCPLEVTLEEEPTLTVKEVVGYHCKKGPEWAEQEIVNPLRTIASSILVEGGDFPLVSVRTDCAIPLGSISGVMKAIKATQVKAPVHIGDILIPKPAGTSCNIIATRHIRVES